MSDIQQKRPAKLSASFVKTVTRPGRYGEGPGGHGLSFLVKPRTGGGLSKSWSQRVRIGGRPVNIGLGPYPVVTLAEAREVALANRRAIHQGHDPRRKLIPVPTFAEVAHSLLALREKSWQTGAREANIWRSSLNDYAMRVLGDKRVDAITTADVLGVLTPLWADRQETARRLRQRIGAVMRLAIAQGHRSDNPAGQAISHALPRSRAPRPRHRALPYREVANAIRKVRASGTYIGTILCLEFLVLTAVRSGEARLARWDEIDFQTATWSIPAMRMKSRRLHRVPLTSRTIAVLKEARDIQDGSGRVFPSATGHQMGDGVLSKLLHDQEIPAVPHGFRSSFRVWASERTDAPRAVMEAAIAHKLGDAAEQAYARSDLFEKRKDLMKRWADYITAH